MKRLCQMIQIAFTYIGTVVGAGFATGQEILHFFTRYGKWAFLTITCASLFFVWIGSKIMLLSTRIQARSYEDLNKHLFGDRGGKWVSGFMMFVLLCVTSVMLAGAGSLFMEHFHLPYQLGLLITIICGILLLKNGMRAILALNTIVVPLMLLFTILIFSYAIHSPRTVMWVFSDTQQSFFSTWSAPLLYAAFNLAMAQAVLVPLGSHIADEKVIRYGGWAGGCGIGLMLLAGHMALSSHMPGVTQFQIPMGNIASQFGLGVQFAFLLLIYLEIFTTFVADVYGVALQIQHRTSFQSHNIIIAVIFFAYLISQFGFRSLLVILYPLFGCFSLVWLTLIMKKN